MKQNCWLQRAFFHTAIFFERHKSTCSHSNGPVTIYYICRHTHTCIQTYTRARSPESWGIIILYMYTYTYRWNIQTQAQEHTTNTHTPWNAQESILTPICEQPWMRACVCVCAALVQDPRMQANLALLLFGMSFATHIVTKPYVRAFVNVWMCTRQIACGMIIHVLVFDWVCMFVRAYTYKHIDLHTTYLCVCGRDKRKCAWVQERKCIYISYEIHTFWQTVYIHISHPQASEELDKLDTLSYAFNCWWVLLGINFTCQAVVADSMVAR